MIMTFHVNISDRENLFDRTEKYCDVLKLRRYIKRAIPQIRGTCSAGDKKM